MTAVAVSASPPPRRLGMKLLAAALTVVCTVQILLAFEEARTVAAVRAVQTGAPVEQAGDWLARTWSGAVAAVVPPSAIPADPEDSLLTGRFGPADDATSALVTDVTFDAARITVDGADLETTPLRIVAGSEAFARGQTYAQTWRAAPDAQIELRRITAAEPAPRACGDAAPGSLALLHRQNRVDLMLFREGAQPGPDADPATACATWRLEAR